MTLFFLSFFLLTPNQPYNYTSNNVFSHIRRFCMSTTWNNNAASLWVNYMVLSFMYVHFESFFSIRFSSVSLTWRRHGFWHGNTVDIEDQGGVPGQNDAHILCFPIPKGLWHGCGALQCYFVRSPTSGECRWVHGSWQWSTLWHLLQDLKTHHS